jgi:hypothetical protein
MNKVEAFAQELPYIYNQSIRGFVKNALEIVPDYFFSIPASSTGKYHPSYTHGEGGLVRHTRAAVRIALELFRMEEYNFSSDEKDVILASLILHDGWKNGLNNSSFTVTEHPKVAAFAISNRELITAGLDDKFVGMIQDNISTHMGQWTKDFKTGQEILTKPTTKMQKFVHLCDYLASRKCLEMNFDVPMARE